MDTIIALAILIIGLLCYGIDFCTLFTFVSVAISLYENWIDYANDKAAKR